jgi:hypothetical protein
MYKISISGKANSGKDTLRKLITDELAISLSHSFKGVSLLSLADPIKKMAKIMYPNIKNKQLYGPSKFRSEIIPGSFKDGKPLTVRQLLIDLGTEFGRVYNKDVWLDNLAYRISKLKNKSAVIVSDLRFFNELDKFKSLGFYRIRLLRNSALKIDHPSETEQDLIKDAEFDYVYYNEGSLEDLQAQAKNIVKDLLEKGEDNLA